MENVVWKICTDIEYTLVSFVSSLLSIFSQAVSQEIELPDCPRSNPSDTNLDTNTDT